jgi:hypothetical protein
MALKKTVSLTTNLGTIATFADAYIRVDNVNVTKNVCRFFVQTHKEKDGQVLDQKSHMISYEIDGVNPIKQAYESLKTLPEFAGATDC